MAGNSSDYLTYQRRRLLQLIAAAGTTAFAGCLSGNEGSSPTPEDTTQEGDNSDTESQETEQESEPEDYDTPESEHMDTQTLVESWGTTYSGHERDMIDSFSPSQVTEEHSTNWIEGHYESSHYEVLPFSHDKVPEAVVQETPDDGNMNVVKVDQLPSGASDEEVKSALEEDGYELQEQVGNFSVYTTVDEREARAVGEGKHVIAFNKGGSPGPASNVHLEYLNQLISDYGSEENGLHTDVQEILDNLDIQDTFTAFRGGHLWTDLVSGVDTQPVGGATTVNMEDETKYAIWKFGDEETAQQAYEILSGGNGELQNGFTQVGQEGQYLTAAGGFDPNGLYSGGGSTETPLI